MIKTSKVLSVRVVAGKELVDNWKRPMAIVTTETGAFIASAMFAPAWGAMIGRKVQFRHENCKADSQLQWIHFHDNGDC